MSLKGGRMETEPLPWCLKRVAVVAEWRQWSPQWSLNGHYWSAKIGTMVVQEKQKHRWDWKIMFTIEGISTGRPLAHHCASIPQPRRCVCLPPASFEQPMSNQLPRQLCATVLNTLKTSRRPWRPSMALSEHPVYHCWTTTATIPPPLILQRRSGQLYCRLMRNNGRSL